MASNASRIGAVYREEYMPNLSLYSLATGAALLCICAPTFAYDSVGLFPQEHASVQRCYGAAMVGMDSVINSRIGVLPEHALELARVSQRGAAGDEVFSTELLNNVLAAYLWDGSPHSYAVKVFFECAQRQAPVRSAGTALDAVMP